MSDLPESGEIVWVYCLSCKHETKHDVLLSKELTTEPREDGSGPPCTIMEIFQIASCRGCDSHCFRFGRANIFEEEWRWRRFPEQSKRRAPLFSWFLPDSVRALYEETLKANNSRALILAAAGLRATVEAVCKDKGFVRGDLKSKIDDMCAAGVLPKDNAEYLHQQRFLGNNAVHGMDRPPESEFVLAFEILEHLLQSLYDLPIRAKQLERLRAERGAQTQ